MYRNYSVYLTLTMNKTLHSLQKKKLILPLRVTILIHYVENNINTHYTLSLQCIITLMGSPIPVSAVLKASNDCSILKL